MRQGRLQSKTVPIAAAAQGTSALDALFNCAGMVANSSMLECTEADWDLSFDLNVKRMFRMTPAFMPAMLHKAQTPGVSVSIINMASMASSIKGFANRCAPARWIHDLCAGALPAMNHALSLGRHC